MESPGWLLRTPPTWLAHAPDQAAGQPPEPFSAWAANGRLLAFPYLGRQAFWPLLPTPGLGWQPVPGFQPVAAGFCLEVSDDAVKQFRGAGQRTHFDFRDDIPSSTGASRSPGCYRLSPVSIKEPSVSL